MPNTTDVSKNHRLQNQAETLTNTQRLLIAAASNHYVDGLLTTAETLLQERLATAEIDFSEIRHSLEQRRLQAEKGFTIALFGRTGAGKSTLAAILTQSEQPVIGKGAQRTTRKTAEYRWENLLVLDTPGIAAADKDGKKDMELAFAAADSADLIIFIATEDSPQPAEAHCLAELHRRGKSLLALMNCKQTIASPEDRAEFLDYPETAFNDQDLNDRQHQFDTLVQLHSSNRPPRFEQAHFQSMLAAQKEQDSAEAAALSAASRLLPALQNIKQQAAKHSQRSALKTPIDLALPSLQDQSRGLLEQSQFESLQTAVLEKEIAELKDWLPEFKKSAQREIQLRIAEMLRPLRQSVPQFAEDYPEKDNIESIWKSRVTRATKDSKALENLGEKWVAELNKRAQRTERNIAADIRFNENHASWRAFKKGKIFDTKRLIQWGSGIGGIATTVAGLLAFTGPVGWIAGGIIAAVGIIGSIFGKSKKDKLQERIAELRRSLNSNIDNIANHYSKQMHERLDVLTNKFSAVIDQARTEQEQKSQGQARSHAAAGKDLRALLQQGHKKLIKETLSIAAVDSEILGSLHAVGRIPGQQTFLMSHPQIRLKENTAQLLEAILDEPVQILPYTEDPTVILQHCLDEPQLKVVIDPESRTAIIAKDNLDLKQTQRLQAAELLADLYVSGEKE